MATCRDRFDKVRLIEPDRRLRAYQAWDKARSCWVSIWAFDCLQSPQAVREQILRTQQTLARLAPLGLLPILDWRIARGRVVIAYQTLPSPDVLSRVSHNGSASLAGVTDVIRQLIGLLDRAHGHMIYHGHLGPHQVFLLGDHRVLVTEMGLAQIVAKATGQYPPRWAGQRWVAPEVRDEQRPRVSGDVYAVGQLITAILESAGLPVPEAWQAVLRAATAIDPRRRPPTVKALERQLVETSPESGRRRSGDDDEGAARRLEEPAALERQMMRLLGEHEKPRVQVAMRPRRPLASRLAAAAASVALAATAVYAALDAEMRRAVWSWLSSAVSWIADGESAEIERAKAELRDENLHRLSEPERIALILRYARHERSSVRDVALNQLSRQTGSDAAQAAKSLLDSPEASVRSSAARCLVNMPMADHLKLLRELAARHDRLIDEAVAPVMARLAAASDAPYLRAWAMDARMPEAIRSACLEALARLKDPDAAETFVAALRSEDKEVRHAALQHVGPWLGPSVLGPLRTLLAQAAGAERVRLVHAIGRLRTPQANQILLGYLASCPDSELAQAVRAVRPAIQSRQAPFLEGIAGEATRLRLAMRILDRPDLFPAEWALPAAVYLAGRPEAQGKRERLLARLLAAEVPIDQIQDWTLVLAELPSGRAQHRTPVRLSRLGLSLYQEAWALAGATGAAERPTADEIHSLLRSPWPAVRAAAAEAIGLAGWTSHKEAVRALVTDRFPWVRCRARDSLALLEGQAPAPPAAETSRRSVDERATRLARTLAAIKEPDLLAAELARHFPADQPTAWTLLAEVQTPAMDELLRQWSRSGDARFPFQAAYLLSHRPCGCLSDVLTAMAGSGSAGSVARQAAVAALGARAEAQALPILQQALHSPSAMVRHHAACALGDLGKPETVPKLLASLSRESSTPVRMAMSLALAKLAPGQEGPRLEKMLSKQEMPRATREFLALAMRRFNTAK